MIVASPCRCGSVLVLGVVSLLSRVVVAQPAEVASAANLPPTSPTLLPQQYEAGPIVAVIGKTLRLAVVSSDPEGQPVRFTATGLPSGANFSETEGLLTLAPTPEQRGSYVVRFVASDGQLQSQRVVTLLVTDNRRPRLDRISQTLSVDSTSTIPLEGSDPDGDTLVYSSDNLPEGASLDPERGVVTFRPMAGQVGQYVIHTAASDGSLTAESELFLTVQGDGESGPDSEWESFFMPGVGYSVYTPRDHARWGTMHGATIEVLLGSWIHHNDNRGPSHGRIYLQAELLDSTRQDVPILFTYAAGFSLSLERNPHRRWLLPMFGLDAGGMNHDQMGGRFQVVPFAGVHAYSSPNLFINLRGGYRLVPADMEHLGGWHVSATVNLSVW
jgi:hypothetical protein